MAVRAQGLHRRLLLGMLLVPREAAATSLHRLLLLLLALLHRAPAGAAIGARGREGECCCAARVAADLLHHEVGAGVAHAVRACSVRGHHACSSMKGKLHIRGQT
jgi:hypothetical protein